MKRTIAALALLLLLVAGVRSYAQTTQPVAAKKVYFWTALWPDMLGKYDPEKDALVEKVKLKNGLWYGWQLTPDSKRAFVITGQRTIIEIVDLVTKQVVDEHKFAEQGFITRIERTMQVPGGTHLYIRVSRIKLVDDHYEEKKEEWLHYNLAERKIEKRMKDLPEAIRRGARISPDGKKWHCFGRDLTIVDPVTLKEEGKIELSKPLYAGMGALRVDSGEDFFNNKNPDAYRFLYTMSDPVKKNRTIFGLLDLDMKEKKVSNLVEWGSDPGTMGMSISYDKKFAAAQLGGFRGGGDGGGKSRLAMFDLSNGKKLCEQTHEFRPRRWMMGIAPDGSKVYIGGAGNDLDVFDSKLNFIKTVWLEHDLSGNWEAVEE